MTKRLIARPSHRFEQRRAPVAAMLCVAALLGGGSSARGAESAAPTGSSPDFLPFPSGSDKPIDTPVFVPSQEVSLSTVLAPPAAAPAPKSAALRPLSEVVIQTGLPAGGALPTDSAAQVHASAADGVLPVVSPWADQRPWMSYEFAWVASNMVHRPLYFEDLNLERYGNSACPALQPAISGARFAAELSLLPYQMAIHRPRECIYLLGYCRPGSRAPNLAYVPPLRLDAAAVEAAAITGAVFIIP